MRKLFFIILLSLLNYGCDGVGDSILDPNDGEFSVIDINAPSSLKYSGSDTKLVTSITFSDTKSILKTWINLSSQDGTIDIVYQSEMEKSAENVFSTSIVMDKEMPSVTYTIDYFYQTEIQANKKIASHNFEYDNMQNNVAPKLSDLIIPNEIDKDVSFAFSVRVTDENGYDDVESVFYELFRPNGDQVENSQGITEFPMFDDGDTANNGDLVAGDSIYTVKLLFPSSVESGTWKLELSAKDRSGAISNTITHNLVVK